MSQDLRKNIEELFQNAPKTKAAYELKEELLANSNERYEDLIKEGVPEKEALEIVIHSIGDVDQLLAEVEPHTSRNDLDDATVKKIALYRAIAIAIFIIGFAGTVIIDEVPGFGSLSFVFMLVAAALGVSILVYVGAAYPKYRKTEDTVVEDFKEWNHNQKKIKSIQGSVSTIVWMIVLIAYFVISFATMAWYITWVMFLVGACAQAIVSLVFQLKDRD